MYQKNEAKAWKREALNNTYITTCLINCDLGDPP